MTRPLLDTEYPDELHRIPMDDLREHEVSGGCWCRPYRYDRACEHGWYFVWTHRAADGRDYYDEDRIPLQ